MMATNALLRGLQPIHPGEMLREDVLPSLGKSKTEIDRLLGISRQTLFDILRERQPVTPAMALRFGKLLGNGPDLCRFTAGLRSPRRREATWEGACKGCLDNGGIAVCACRQHTALPQRATP